VSPFTATNSPQNKPFVVDFHNLSAPPDFVKERFQKYLIDLYYFFSAKFKNRL